jgi:hypothetical protein
MSLGFTLWNMSDGFVDGLLRGWRSTFLTDMEYQNLKEGGRRGGSSDTKLKEDFEDMRLTLQESDYGNFLANEPRLDPKIIGMKVRVSGLVGLLVIACHGHTFCCAPRLPKNG